MRNFTALIALFLLICFPVIAQPTSGTTYSGVLPLGSGRSIALPEGRWELTGKLVYSEYGFDHDKYILINKSENPKVFALVVTPFIQPNKWGDTNCTKPNANVYQTNAHNTTSSQLVNKCSGFYNISNFDGWRDKSRVRLSRWWTGVQDSLLAAPGSGKQGVFLAEFNVQKYNDIRISVEAFIAPPASYSAPVMRDMYLKGDIKQEHEILNNWAKIFISSLESSFFNKEPKKLADLAYLVNKNTESKIATKTSVGTANLNEDDYDKIIKMASEGENVNNTEKRLEIANVQIKPNTPINKNQNSTVNSPVVPSAPAAASANTNIDELIKSLEKEKREVASQMEQMKKMLAQMDAEKNKEIPNPLATNIFANRKALVIGNDNYKSVSKLNNAVLDAKEMSKTLTAVGYKVSIYIDIDEKAFKQALRDFKLSIQGGDEVLVFFAGHGVQLGATNYLLPTDIKGDNEEQVKDEAIQLQRILDDLQEKKAKFSLAIIDACRDNPFKTQGRAIGGRGLAPTTAATGQMVMFSAGTGQQALDKLGNADKEKNGLFTRILLKEMIKPGLSVDRVLRNVRAEVVALAKSIGHEQTPALYDQAVGDFYFKK